MYAIHGNFLKLEYVLDKHRSGRSATTITNVFQHDIKSTPHLSRLSDFLNIKFYDRMIVECALLTSHIVTSSVVLYQKQGGDTDL